MSSARKGTVYLVGAGPGSEGLVTKRALELIESADVLLVDRLIPRELRTRARSGAEVIDVGKTAGDHAMPQDEINERLVSEALAGRSVVRVKGGDPYLFGRGGEEALRCLAAKVPFEVVPGVTSAFAACAAAGIPVTHRDLARNVTVVTASAGRDGQGDPDYAWLAGSDGTIVLLMGLRRVDHVASELMAAGMPPSRPCAVISRGTTAEQRVVSGTLSTITALVERASLASPAIIVVGDVVELRDDLAWLEKQPLFGTRIAVTRARAQASDLARQLDALGAQVVEVPAIRVEPLDPVELDAGIDALRATDTVVFTSRNGVDRVFARLAERGMDVRAFGNVTTIAAVGDGTAQSLHAHGLLADVVPPAGKQTALGLLDQLSALPLFGTSCILFRAERGDERLPDGLRGIDVAVTVVPVYRTIAEPATIEQVAALEACDIVTLASASTVTNTLAMVAGDAARVPPCITIGPVTSEAARDAGLTILQQAAVPSVTGLVAAVLDQTRSS